MSECLRELTYRCRDDCRIEGCPSHKATLIFQSSTNIYNFKLDSKEFILGENELQAMIDLIKLLNNP